MRMKRPPLLPKKMLDMISFAVPWSPLNFCDFQIRQSINAVLGAGSKTTTICWRNKANFGRVRSTLTTNKIFGAEPRVRNFSPDLRFNYMQCWRGSPSWKYYVKCLNGSEEQVVWTLQMSAASLMSSDWFCILHQYSSVPIRSRRCNWKSPTWWLKRLLSASMLQPKSQMFGTVDYPTPSFRTLAYQPWYRYQHAHWPRSISMPIRERLQSVGR